MSDTINYGIDLGTTNSAIAVADQGTAKIVRGPGNVETIPSAVNITRTGSIRVGHRAADLVVEDPENAYAEFKLRMGRSDQDVLFEATGRTMSPEELSAQVLMSLRSQVEGMNLPGRTPDRVRTAVITFPAAFTVDQSAATVRAAELAGLVSPTLLQEPTAAAWAYMNELEDPPSKGFWLVYDFGGGTFDAAVVKLDDGEFSVIEHAGNNSLGGKRVDWSLVEDFLLPALDLPLGSPDILDDKTMRGPKAKLKKHAELAKIELATSLTAEVVDDLDVGGVTVPLQCTLTRADLAKAAMPLVESTVRLCRQAIDRAGLTPKDIERVVLVGGSSQLALVREMLSDPQTGLGIPLDDSQDPMTVVARGAAIYAGRQPLPPDVGLESPMAQGTVRVILDYPRAGQDDDPLLGGRVESDQTSDWTGWTIEVINSSDSSRWTTGQVPLKVDGSFGKRLKVFDGHGPKTFELTLRSPDGTVTPISQDTITYLYTDRPMGEDAARTTYDVGVGLHDNSMQVLVPRNSTVPRKGAAIGLKTSQAVSVKDRTGQIVIPIFQGDHAQADRNDMVGRLIIGPDDVTRDVPAGVGIDVSLRVDQSFQIEGGMVYIDYLGDEFKMTIDPNSPPTPTLDELDAKHLGLIERLNESKTAAGEIDATDVELLIATLETDGTLAEIEKQLAQARMDPDAARTCDHAIRVAHSVLDRVEKETKVPKLVHDLGQLLAVAEEVVQVYGRASERQRLAKLRNDAAAAIAGRDESVLERRVQEVAELVMTILPPDPSHGGPGGGGRDDGPKGPPIPGAPIGSGWPTT